MATPRRKPGRKPKTDAPADQPQPTVAPAGAGPDLIESLEALKPLIAQYGADKVKRLVDLLG